MQKIKIDLGFAVLVAEQGADTNYNEIFIFLENKDGMCIQDLAIIGQKYHYDEDLNVVHEDSVDVKIYADENNEDYTHQFDIGVYKEEE